MCHSQAQLNGLLRSKHHRLVHLLPHPDGNTVEHGATAGKAGLLLVSTLMPYCTPRWMLSVMKVSRACPGTWRARSATSLR